MPILKGAVLDKRDDLSYLVPDKMRAMTLRFDERNTDASFIRPGSFVDILGTFKNGRATPFTKTILQNITVMAVNGKTKDDFSPEQHNGIHEVTVLVKAQDTEKLALAKSQASLQIVLRNIHDNEELEKGGIDEESILFGTHNDDEPVNADHSGINALFNQIHQRDRKVKVIRGTEIHEVRL
jgi:Flp pilus assembly protein CpaB